MVVRVNASSTQADLAVTIRCLRFSGLQFQQVQPFSGVENPHNRLQDIIPRPWKGYKRRLWACFPDLWVLNTFLVLLPCPAPWCIGFPVPYLTKVRPSTLKKSFLPFF